MYTCRFCHDENEDHSVNRKEVTELICTNCETRQKVQAECQNCGIRFGKVTIHAKILIVNNYLTIIPL